MYIIPGKIVRKLLVLFLNSRLFFGNIADKPANALGISACLKPKAGERQGFLG